MSKGFLMEPVRLRELAQQLEAELVGDGEVLITGAAGLEAAGPGDITFLASKALASKLPDCSAAALIIGRDLEPDRPALRVDDPYAAFVQLLKRLGPDPDRVFPPGQHPTAVVDPSADVSRAASIGPYAVIGAGTVLGAGCRLGAHVVLGPDVTLGDDCCLYPHVVVREGCELKNRVILHAGCTIGNDGFGYLPGPSGLVKVPQVGRVVIGDDAEIGASTTIDRATTGETVIGPGSKLDNLVQIGHNVVLGGHGAISAQTGVSGSCRIGDRVTMGGQVGLADHITIGDDVKIGAKSGLHRDVPAGGTVFGYPALDAREAFRVVGALRKLPDVIRTVAKLEETVRALEESRGGSS